MEKVLEDESIDATMDDDLIKHESLGGNKKKKGNRLIKETTMFGYKKDIGNTVAINY